MHKFRPGAAQAEITSEAIAQAEQELETRAGCPGERDPAPPRGWYQAKFKPAYFRRGIRSPRTMKSSKPSQRSRPGAACPSTCGMRSRGKRKRTRKPVTTVYEARSEAVARRTRAKATLPLLPLKPTRICTKTGRSTRAKAPALFKTTRTQDRGARDLLPEMQSGGQPVVIDRWHYLPPRMANPEKPAKTVTHYVPVHLFTGKRRPTITRLCACGCGETFVTTHPTEKCTRTQPTGNECTISAKSRCPRHVVGTWSEL